MKQSEATELLDTYFKTQWLALHGSLDYAFENESFRGASASWVRVSLVPGASEQRSMGAAGRRRFEHKGTITVQLFGALDAGRKPLELLVDSVRTFMQSKHLSTAGDPLWTKAASVAAAFQRDGWWQVTMTIPFSYFELA
jgi:hypothetical protein